MKKTHKITFTLRIILFLQFILISIAHAALENGVPFHTWVDGKTLANTTIIVPDEATKLIVSISDGSGDLDLYLKYGSPVSGGTISAIDADADIRSDGATADETITLTPSTIHHPPFHLRQESNRQIASLLAWVTWPWKETP